MAKLYEPFAWISLALLGVLGVAHLAAIAGVIALPVGIAFAVVPFIFTAQIVMIVGLNGGSFRGRSAGFVRQWQLAFAALRYVPRGWRIFGIPFWYAYVPGTFFWRMSRSSGTIEEVGGQLFLIQQRRMIRSLTASQAFSIRADHFISVTAILMAFAFAHFMVLRFIIPNRQNIIDDVDRTAT